MLFWLSIRALEFKQKGNCLVDLSFIEILTLSVPRKNKQVFSNVLEFENEFPVVTMKNKNVYFSQNIHRGTLF